MIAYIFELIIYCFSMNDLWEGKYDAGVKKIGVNFGVLHLCKGGGGGGIRPCIFGMLKTWHFTFQGEGV